MVLLIHLHNLDIKYLNIILKYHLDKAIKTISNNLDRMVSKEKISDIRKKQYT